VWKLGMILLGSVSILNGGDQPLVLIMGRWEKVSEKNTQVLIF